jgi:hypothetical protein
MKAMLVWVIACCPLAACASDQASRFYLDHPLPPKPTDQVAILHAPPTAAYEVIADFQSRGETPRDMQRRAAEAGADAVVVVIAGGYRDLGEERADHDNQSTSYSRIMGTAIRYKETR